jgi:hypothetical protein
MKRGFLFILMVFTIQSLFAETSADKNHYRRSSLCLVLLTHKDKKYAEGM